MSIVLEALEKAQREGKKEKKKETLPRREPSKDISLPRAKKRSRRYGIFFWVIILCVAGVNLWLLSWWLNHTQSTPSQEPSPGTEPSTEVEVSPPISPPTITLIPQEREVLPETEYPVLTVTGIVWDPQEPIALVNGKFLREGEEILGAMVKEIQLNRVTFLYKDEEFTIAVEQ